jgi:hypothetical protein
VKTLVVRKIVKTEVDATGLGAEIRDAQKKSGKSVEVIIREVNISRTYWNNIVNEKIDALSWDLLVKIEGSIGWKSGIQLDESVVA